MERRLVLLATLVVACVVGGCELIAGLQDRTLLDGGADVMVPDVGLCPMGETTCGATCVNTKTDMNHCGSCTTACISGFESCDAGACQSACAPKSLCVVDGGTGDAAAYCADLKTDLKDCGRCGNTCLMGASCDGGACACPPGTQTFGYTGSAQMFVVPSCVTQVTVTAYGAAGANANDVYPAGHTGGKGGSATGTLAVTPGATLNVYVGGQGNGGVGGFNGGATGGTSTAGSSCFGGPAGGGGGMSDVRVGGNALTNIVIAAAGGGGSGRDYCNTAGICCGCGGGNGGGGGATGVNGGPAYDCGHGYPGSGVNGGQGGTQTSGGAGGTGDGSGAPGIMGSQGSGGGGASGAYDVAGGGGGGGYYGGGGGGGATSGSGIGGGGGGGGASYVGGVTGGSTVAAVQAGNGQVVITW